jgi:hypothetical protein
MAAKNPRVNIVVEAPIYGVMQDLAEHQGISLSALGKVLITEALELREDADLARFAEEREKTFDREKALTHQEIWD